MNDTFANIKSIQRKVNILYLLMMILFLGALYGVDKLSYRMLGNPDTVIFSFWLLQGVITLRVIFIALITWCCLIIINKSFLKKFMFPISQSVIDTISYIADDYALQSWLEQELSPGVFAFLIQSIVSFIMLILTEINTVRPGSVFLCIIGTILALLLSIIIQLSSLYITLHIARLYTLYDSSKQLNVIQRNLLRIALRYNSSVEEYNEMNQAIETLGDELDCPYKYNTINLLDTDNYPTYSSKDIHLLFFGEKVMPYCNSVNKYENDVQWYDDRSKEQIMMMDVIIDKKQKLMDECNHTLAIIKNMSVPPRTRRRLIEFIIKRFKTLSERGKLEKKITDMPKRSFIKEIGQAVLGDIREVRREKQMLEEDVICKRLDLVVEQMKEFHNKIESLLSQFQTTDPELIAHLDKLCGIHVENLNSTVNRIDKPKKKKGFLNKLFGG